MKVRDIVVDGIREKREMKLLWNLLRSLYYYSKNSVTSSIKIVWPLHIKLVKFFFFVFSFFDEVWVLGLWESKNLTL